jgi:hypothetical protein
VAQGYAFLVARGRHTGFRTLLAPGFLVESDLHHVLAESTGASGAVSGEVRVVEVDSAVGPFSVGYASEPVARAEIEPPGADGAEPLEDEHGRALEIVYGVVCRDELPSRLDAGDLRTAREQALRRYRAFLVDEGEQRVEPSAPFALCGAASRRAGSVRWRRLVANGLLALLPIAGLLAVFSPTFVLVLVAVSLLLVGASAIVRPPRDGDRA